MYRYILFDLDGTLSDPKVGICTCVQYALGKMGIVEEDIEKLTPFIGPPLRDSFKEFYNMNDEEAEQAITYYRERFSTVGLFENELYPGIPELLRDLKKKERKIAIASSKPLVFVERILEHFEIKEYFDVIVGSTLDGKFEKKEDILAKALEDLLPNGTDDYEETVMIGDRKFDIEAALKIGTHNIGVSYGYGSREELEEAGADRIVNTVTGLRTILLPVMGMSSAPVAERTSQDNSNGTSGNKVIDWKAESKRQGEMSFAKTFGMIGPILTYWLVAPIVYYAIALLLGIFYPQMASGTQTTLDANIELISQTTNIICSLVPCLLLIRNFRRLEKAKNAPADENDILKKRKVRLTKKPVLFTTGMSRIEIASVFLGVVVFTMGYLATCSLKGYTENQLLMIEGKNAIPVVLGILYFGIMMPFMDEFVFTAISYRRACEFMSPTLSLLMISVLYMFVIGTTGFGSWSFAIIIAALYVYMRTQKLYMPMLLHMAAATVGYLQDRFDAIGSFVKQAPLCYIMSIIGFVLFVGVFVYDTIKCGKENGEAETKA